MNIYRVKIYDSKDNKSKVHTYLIEANYKAEAVRIASSQTTYDFDSISVVYLTESKNLILNTLN